MQKFKPRHAQFTNVYQYYFAHCVFQCIHKRSWNLISIYLEMIFFVQKLSLLLWQELKWHKISIFKCDFFPSEQGNYLLFELPPVMFICLSKLRNKHWSISSAILFSWFKKKSRLAVTGNQDGTPQGRTKQTDPRNSRLPTWLGCFGCQQVAGYPKTKSYFLQ